MYMYVYICVYMKTHMHESICIYECMHAPMFYVCRYMYVGRHACIYVDRHA